MSRISPIISRILTSSLATLLLVSSAGLTLPAVHAASYTAPAPCYTASGQSTTCMVNISDICNNVQSLGGAVNCNGSDTELMQSIQRALDQNGDYEGMSDSCASDDGLYGSCTQKALQSFYDGPPTSSQGTGANAGTTTTASGLPPCAAQSTGQKLANTAGNAFTDGVVGAGLGAIGGAIAGNAGKGALIGAGAGVGLSLLHSMLGDNSQSITTSIGSSLLPSYFAQAQCNNAANGLFQSSALSAAGISGGAAATLAAGMGGLTAIMDTRTQAANVVAGYCGASRGPIASALSTINQLGQQYLGLQLGTMSYNGKNFSGALNLGSSGRGCITNAVLNGPGAQGGLQSFRQNYAGNTYGSAIGMVTGWVNFALGFLFVLAVTILIYAGFLYVTGVQANVDKAKKIIPYVVIGIILIFSAYAIVNTVLSGTTG